jgi:Pycsar effector protein
MADRYSDDAPERHRESAGTRSRWHADVRDADRPVVADSPGGGLADAISWRRLALRVLLRDARSRTKAGKPADAEAAEPVISYLTGLLSETRQELSRVDSKASLLLAAVGVVLGALIGGLAGSRWTPMRLNGAVHWLWWLGTASATIGVLLIAAAVYPRIYPRGTPQPGAPVYYGHVSAYRDIGEFRRALEEPPSTQDRLINQIFVLSRIVRRKYALLRSGLWCLLLTTMACALAVTISPLLGS